MLLSALAQPFQPAFSSPAGLVFNDGAPSALMLDHDLVCGYSGEALDENFPPSAQEAAEIEAVETFVGIMAYLSMLEEKEERARSSFCHIQKRWEARREDGLVSKPRQAKHSVEIVDHNKHVAGKTLTTTDLVSLTHSLDRALAAKDLQSRSRSREEFRRVNNKKGGKMNGQRIPVHQPRKQN